MKLKRAIFERFEAKDLGEVGHFLGVRVVRDRVRKTICLIQDSYIEKMIARYFGEDIPKDLPHVPLACKSGERYKGVATKQEIKGFQERIGSAMYCAMMTRPDVAHAVADLSRHLNNPSPEHRIAADKLLLYLYRTRYLGIQFGGEHQEIQLMIASDAAFADDSETRKSSQGCIMSLFGGPVIWKAGLQATVTTSTTEAELLALEHTTKESIALKRLFREICLDLGEPIRVFCDNQQTIRLVVNDLERLTTRLKHVDIQNMWLKQEHRKGTFEVTYLSTAEMPADGLTKPLTRQPFEHFRALLNLKTVILKKT